MIEYIKGIVDTLTPAYAVVESAGVGYGLNISLNTYSTIQGKKEVKLYVYEAIREDAHVLYGFANRKERELFLLLISVSGIGAGTARVILSELSPEELCDVIASGNEKMLKGVKGIGLKTAQRIIVDLKDKIVTSGVADKLHSTSGRTQSAAVANPVKDEAISALTMLGFAPAPSAKVVVAILEKNPSAPVEEVIKMALKQIK